MRRKKSPLEPLARLKEDRAESKTRELGRAISEREAAAHTRVAAEAAREAERARARTVRGDERALLEEGELVAGDLLRAEAWESRTRLEDAGRTREVERTRAAEEKAMGVEAEAKVSVTRARAEAEVVDRQLERWKASVQKAEEASEEEAVDEAYRPKRAT